MSYHRKSAQTSPETVLVARRGYGDFGIMGGSQGVPIGADYYGRSRVRQRGVGSALGNVLDSVFGGLKAGINYYGQTKQQEGALNVLQQGGAMQQPVDSGMPSWLLPVALLGGGIALVVYLKKRKG